MPQIPSLTDSYIDETYPRLVQVSGSSFADGLGNPISFGGATIPNGPINSLQYNLDGTNFSGSANLTFSGSNTLTLTGSLKITGSTTQIGNNNLFGNTTLSGSLTISGSVPGTATNINIYGDTSINGTIKFLPSVENIDNSVSASYIYVSGSTNDLYFTQNGNGYANTTRLRWLEGNLYTGLLNGGIITATIGSNTYQISSGSGIIVTLNTSFNDNPYPTVQYINWGNLTGTIDALSASFDQQFVAVSSSAGTPVIKASGTPYSDGDYNTFIPIGIVIHQNRSTINAVQTFPGVAYGWKQRSFDFIKAFGPLKIAGYTLAQSGSSTRGLVLSGGTAWVDGRNYTVDPNNPSYIVEATGITTSKIYKYHQSGSGWVYDTNAGAGYTDIDPTQYSNNGVLTAVPTNNWSLQRVFYFPNSATKAFYIYYGNAVYSSKDNAIAGILTETFSEAPNTAANAIFVGYMILRHNADFTVAASYEFRPAGLFRSSGIGGASGGGGATTLAALTDVSLGALSYGDLLMYNASTGLWNNTHTLSGSYILSGSLTTNDGVSVQTLTASIISASQFTGSLFGTASYATTASYAANGGVTQILAGSGITLSPTNGLGQVTITSTGGGGVYGNTATGSYGSFFSTQTQTAGAINTPYSMSFNNTDISNGVSISGSASSSIKITNAGVYDLQFSSQLNKVGSGGGVINILIWLRKNNIDLAATNTYVQLQGGANSKIVAAWNWFLNAAAGDEYRIMWATDDVNGQIYYDPAPTTGPVVPSVIATVARVDQFLSNTGSFSGSFNGIFTGSLQGTASWATNFVSASNYVLNSATSSFVQNNQTSSFVTNSQTSSFVTNSQTSSFVQNSQTSSFVTNSQTSSFATTGSNSFNGNTTITGSLTVVTGSSVEFQVTNTGVKIGNTVSDVHTITGSLNISSSAAVVSATEIGYLSGSTSNIQTQINNKGYSINFGAAQSTYVANTTYYFGMVGAGIATNQAVRRVYIPLAGTVRETSIYVNTTNGTLGETWTMSFRLNNTSSVVIASTANTSTAKVYTNSNLGVAVVAGDYFEITTTTPATAPGVSNVYGTIIIH